MQAVSVMVLVMLRETLKLSPAPDCKATTARQSPPDTSPLTNLHNVETRLTGPHALCGSDLHCRFSLWIEWDCVKSGAESDSRRAVEQTESNFPGCLVLPVRDFTVVEGQLAHLTKLQFRSLGLGQLCLAKLAIFSFLFRGYQ